MHGEGGIGERIVSCREADERCGGCKGRDM